MSQFWRFDRNDQTLFELRFLYFIIGTAVFFGASNVWQSPTRITSYNFGRNYGSRERTRRLVAFSMYSTTLCTEYCCILTIFALTHHCYCRIQLLVATRCHFPPTWKNRFVSCIRTISLTPQGVSINQVLNAIRPVIIARTVAGYDCFNIDEENVLDFIDVCDFLADHPASLRW